jgi:lipoprotein-anchoring transpeptidase ErfK/SrfK
VNRFLGVAAGLALALAVAGPGWGAHQASDAEPAVPASVRSAVAIQIALEGQGFSPGLIDGSIGAKTRMALAAFQAVSGLPPSGDADEATLRALAPDPRAAFGQTVISPTDPEEVDPPPRDWLERSKKRRLLYPSLSNLIAERAHTTERFLAALNPGRPLADLGPGDLLFVPAASAERRFSGTLERIEIDLERKAIFLFSGKRPVPSGLLFCSIAADPAKAIPGDSRVATVCADPTYTFDPLKWPEVHGIEKKLTIPPGPRSPVGLRWIGLEREGVGIHGSPEPENIGKTGSHGCFRLTNWDAVWLGSLVRTGTPVRILRSASESSWRWDP